RRHLRVAMDLVDRLVAMFPREELLLAALRVELVVPGRIVPRRETDAVRLTQEGLHAGDLLVDGARAQLLAHRPAAEGGAVPGELSVGLAARVLEDPRVGTCGGLAP